ncbi:hypothetical protein ACVW0P_000357 [Mucilaginibacter sp. UYNi724]
MKKYYAKSNSALLILFLLTFALIINSCKKDLVNSPPSATDQKEQIAFVKDAKDWFGRNEAINKEQPLATNTVGSALRKWNEALKPDQKYKSGSTGTPCK